MSIDTTPSAPWSPRPAATSAAVEPTQTGPAADIWTLLDELAARGRALRLLAEERKWRTSVRRKIAAGVRQARAGKLVDGDRAVARLRKRIGSPRGKRS